MTRLTLLELNEFNDGLLHQAASTMNVPHLRRVLDLRRTHTSTADVYANRSLEPWVQWVSAHTGVPYDTHGILHIGDLPPPALPQIWERLSAAGLSSGVWGALNATRGAAEHCRFFVPDPWTFGADAHPTSLTGLIALPRFLARNRLRVLQPELVPVAASLARSFVRPSHLAAALREVPRLAARATADPTEAYVYFTAFEYLAAARFAELKRRHDPAFSLLFVNMLAHAQHYWWHPLDLEHNPRMRYVLAYVDRVIGEVLEALQPGEELIVFNGFEQFNIAEGVRPVVYRQRDHHGFLAKRLGIRAVRVDAHMTNDAHVLLEHEAGAARAEAALRAAHVGGEPLFHVETYADEPRRLFYRIEFLGELPPGATYRLDGQDCPFWDDFEALGTHTGRHGPRGTVYSTLGDLPEEVPNHELLGHVMDHFGVRGWPSAAGRDQRHVLAE